MHATLHPEYKRMKVLECEAKLLLAASGLTVPEGKTVTTAQEAVEAARQLGHPVVIKAQIPSGGRMKAGGIRFADTPEEAAEASAALFAQPLLGHPVHTILVEERLDIVREVFVAVTYDGRARRAALLASSTGGIDIESEARMVRREFSLLALNPVPDYLGREVATELGFNGAALLRLSAAINALVERFVLWDALLLEINPLVLTAGGQWVVADAHLEIDDDALYRQRALLDQLPLSQREANRRSEFERRAAEIDSADHRGVAGRLVPFDGDLGLLIGGGGASLTIMDAVLDAGLRPANYCEIGGNPSVWKVKELAKLILSRPGVQRLAVIMNVVSNTRVDLVARGVIKAALELGREPREAIAAFRIPGSWEEEGKAILRHYGVEFFDRDASIDQVVEAIRWQSS
jgi:succinyl-CoA synthetase beta subunit